MSIRGHVVFSELAL